MSAKDEAEKAKVRKQRLSAEEVELEGARERFHKDRKSRAARAEFREVQHAVARARQEARRQRESEAPPEGADVKRDADGRVMGWEIAGDAVAAPGGRDV